MHVKLCDFGEAYTLTNSQTYCQGHKGATKFMAPEMLEKNGKYDLKADIWSAGITMYKLLLDDYPY